MATASDTDSRSARGSLSSSRSSGVWYGLPAACTMSRGSSMYTGRLLVAGIHHTERAAHELVVEPQRVVARHPEHVAHPIGLQLLYEIRPNPGPAFHYPALHHFLRKG